MMATGCNRCSELTAAFEVPPVEECVSRAAATAKRKQYRDEAFPVALACLIYCIQIVLPHHDVPILFHRRDIEHDARVWRL